MVRNLWDRFRCWRIDIVGAEEIRPGFCLSCRIRKSQMYGGIFRTFRCPYRLENFLRYLAREAYQRRDGCLLCLTGQTVILWVPPWSGTVRFCWGRCSEEHGFGDLRCAQSSGDLIGCVWKIRGLDFELCRGRNFIEWADKGLGGLAKEHPVF